jgi:hypothetical protein
MDSTSGIDPDLSTDHEYWQALGQFIEAFTRAENQLFMYLIWLIGVNNLVGKALFQRDKCDQLIKHIREVWKVRPISNEQRKELDDVLSHMTIINNERNLIVHRISHVFPDIGRVRTNILRAPTDDAIDLVQMRPTQLVDMAHDLGKITDHLVFHWFDPDSSLETRVLRKPELAAPWRYKPPVSIKPKPTFEGRR